MLPPRPGFAVGDTPLARHVGQRGQANSRIVTEPKVAQELRFATEQARQGVTPVSSGDVVTTG